MLCKIRLIIANSGERDMCCLRLVLQKSKEKYQNAISGLYAALIYID